MLRGVGLPDDREQVAAGERARRRHGRRQLRAERQRALLVVVHRTGHTGSTHDTTDRLETTARNGTGPAEAAACARTRIDRAALRDSQTRRRQILPTDFHFLSPSRLRRFHKVEEDGGYGA